jgi:hypothetical protein
MKFISTAVHGMLDYFVAVLLIVLPWLVDFNGPQLYVPVALGIATLVYSLLTDYERGVWPLISMRGHLALDILNGLILAASPWLFHFSDITWLPYLLGGVMEIIVVLFTQTSRRSEHG